VHIVGIIGPYFGGGVRRIIDINISNTQHVMIQIANYFGENGLVGFFAPHSHTARFEVLAQAPESYYHALDDAIYDRACDSFVLLPGWRNSAGSRRDHERARTNEKKIFHLRSYADHDIEKLLATLDEWVKGGQDAA